MKIQNKWITHSLGLSAIFFLVACQSGELPNAISSTNGQSLSALSQNAITLYSDSDPESLIYQAEGEAPPAPPVGEEGMIPPPPPGEFTEGEVEMMPPRKGNEMGMLGEHPEGECKHKHHRHKSRGEGEEGMMSPPPPPEEFVEGEEGQARPPRRRR